MVEGKVERYWSATHASFCLVIIKAGDLMVREA